VLLLAAAVASCSSEPELSYEEQVLADRAAKDRAFLESPESPVPPGEREKFVPLAYFPVDESYRVPAVLTPYEGEPAIEMPTSTGKRRQMRRAGQLRFSLKGQTLTLTAFVDADDRTMDRLFVPFADQTNGTETYAAGRYLDLDRTATSLYDLDFNRSYHPYCYYNPQYDCPYPPRENRLEVPIRSGERNRS
ncbi:MAG TPA: DUF1684 domain-containing protein, partial [Vicinamibacterales bacterium]